MRHLIALSIFIISLLITGTISATSKPINLALPPIDTTYSNKATPVDLGAIGLGLYGSMGIGVSTNRLTLSSLETTPTNQHKKALLMDLTLGFKINNRAYIHVATKYNTIKEISTTGAETDKIVGFEGLGVTYNLFSTQQSVFVSAGVGFSVVQDKTNDINLRGMGAFVGGGYKFNKDLEIKAEVIWGRPKEKLFGSSPAMPTLSAGLTLSYHLHVGG